MKILKIFFVFTLLVNFVNANTLSIKDLNDKNISINQNSYSIVEFDKMIENIKVSDKASLDVGFLENKENPLKSIKIFGKAIGNSNLLVTFIDSTTVHVNVNVVKDLFKIINIAKTISPNLIVKQANEKIILDGKVQNQKTKNKIINLFEKAGVDLEKDFVDLIELESPDKMIRLKLYAVEMSNNNGKDIKNNWVVSSKNFTETVNTDGLYYNANSKDMNSVNAQRSTLLNSTVDGMIANAVSLSGGLTAAANYLGKYFNSALALNYLSTKGYAKVLDETTLLTLENQNATFHAGGTIYIKVATTTAQGVPTTQIRDVPYGLKLNINAENIVDDNFINLKIITESSDVDWSQTVDGIPFFKEKTIETNVVVGNQSTIILGGLSSSNSGESIEKIPVLGDIPLLGKLFTSKSFNEGKSELVFFITPEIVNPENTNEINTLKQKTAFTKKVEDNLNKK